MEICFCIYTYSRYPLHVSVTHFHIPFLILNANRQKYDFFFKQQTNSLIKKHQLVFKCFFLKIFLKAHLKKKYKDIFICLSNFG